MGITPYILPYCQEQFYMSEPIDWLIDQAQSHRQLWRGLLLWRAIIEEYIYCLEHMLLSRPVFQRAIDSYGADYYDRHHGHHSPTDQSSFWYQSWLICFRAIDSQGGDYCYHHDGLEHILVSHWLILIWPGGEILITMRDSWMLMMVRCCDSLHWLLWGY